MDPSIQTHIINAEEQLRLAMLHSDVDTLDALIAPDLIFTNHLGHVLSKQDDLDAHQSGMITIDKLILSEQQIQIVDNVALVSVRAHLAGSYAGQPSAGDFRFTRVWAQSDSGTWQVAAGHASLIAS